MPTKIHTDQMGSEVEVTFPPTRIVSLVPSQTELLHHLGLENEVRGITKFCVHPRDWFQSKVRVGGTKKVNFETIERLKPDLIIANKEENEKSDIEILKKKYPVWVSDIHCLDDATEMIQAIGELTNKATEASSLCIKITERFSKLQSSKLAKKVVYLIWQEPFMAVGQNTFINDMLCKAGFENALSENSSRYPELSLDELKSLNPDLIFLSSEPFPFSTKHAEVFQSFFPRSTIKVVDGELFSWYGSRLLLSSAYFQQLIDQTK